MTDDCENSGLLIDKMILSIVRLELAHSGRINCHEAHVIAGNTMHELSDMSLTGWE
jgi:hypothetical protein